MTPSFGCELLVPSGELFWRLILDAYFSREMKPTLTGGCWLLAAGCWLTARPVLTDVMPVAKNRLHG
jgi:hypothetical protein